MGWAACRTPYLTVPAGGRPDLFAASLRAVKATLDPHGILNPGVVV